MPLGVSPRLPATDAVGEQRRSRAGSNRAGGIFNRSVHNARRVADKAAYLATAPAGYAARQRAPGRMGAVGIAHHHFDRLHARCMDLLMASRP